MTLVQYLLEIIGFILITFRLLHNVNKANQSLGGIYPQQGYQ